MKLYVIEDGYKDEIIAISERKEDVSIFYMQNGYSEGDSKRYVVYKYKNKKDINKILIMYGDSKTIEVYQKYGQTYAMLSGDSTLLNEKIKTEFDKVYETMNIITKVREVSKAKDKKIVDNMLDIIRTQLSKTPKNLVDIPSILGEYYRMEKSKDLIELNDAIKKLIYGGDTL